MSEIERIEVKVEQLHEDINCLSIDVHVLSGFDGYGRKEDVLDFSIGVICLDTGKVIPYPGKLHYFLTPEVRAAIKEQLGMIEGKGLLLDKYKGGLQ